MQKFENKFHRANLDIITGGIDHREWVIAYDLVPIF